MTDTYEMLTADNACALLIDHQPGLYFNTGGITILALRNNTIALAKVLALHKIPTVISCAAQGPKGLMGPLLPEIAACFPDLEPVYRTKINSWHDDRIRAAVEATGRKKVICAGITADFCIGLPAMSNATGAKAQFRAGAQQSSARSPPFQTHSVPPPSSLSR